MKKKHYKHIEHVAISFKSFVCLQKRKNLRTNPEPTLSQMAHSCLHVCVWVGRIRKVLVSTIQMQSKDNREWGALCWVHDDDDD